MKKYKYIIVDDEESIHTIIKFHLSSVMDQFECIHSAYSFNDAVESIEKMRPDFVFLDINLGGCDGLDIMTSTLHKPHYIILSGYIEVNSTKVVLSNHTHIISKPVTNENVLLSAVNKIANLLTGAKVNSKMKSYTVNTQDETQYLLYNDIIALTTHGDGCYIVYHQGNVIKRINSGYNLGHHINQLAGDVFCRINRSTAINVMYIDKLVGSQIKMINSLEKRIVEMPGNYSFKLSDNAKDDLLKCQEFYNKSRTI